MNPDNMRHDYGDSPRSLDELYHRLEFYRKPKRSLWSRIFGGGKPTLNYLLFFATMLTTFGTAYILNDSFAGAAWFSGGIMSILLAHEMGHYVMCRKYGVPASLPYFIPFPPLINPFGIPPIWNPFGTMGAVIKMEGRMPSRRVLFDIGAGGPIAGLVLTIPAIYFGLQMSEIVPVDDSMEGGIIFGESLLFKALAWLAVGDVDPNYNIMLHPLGFAGWAGLFVTALNLFPIGQLDGGHVMYALFGERSRFIYPVVLAIFILIAIRYYPGWILLILLLFLIRIDHPPTMDPHTGLDPGRRVMAVLMFILFLVSFTPVPFEIA